MKGFIKHAATGICFSAALMPFVGCYHYRELVDPCWPERYNSIARQSVRDITNAQADKGHVLDQTIWNWHFRVDEKTGAATDLLNPAGIEQLKYISRRLPVPDSQLYLQNAQDIAYDGKADPVNFVKARQQLNDRRVASIQRVLATQVFSGTAGYSVAIHDFAPPGINVTPIIGTNALPKVQGAEPGLWQNFKGVMPLSTGGSSGGGSGGSGGGGSSGSGGGGSSGSGGGGSSGPGM
jgi:hypothetical protein